MGQVSTRYWCGCRGESLFRHLLGIRKMGGKLASFPRHRLAYPWVMREEGLGLWINKTVGIVTRIQYSSKTSQLIPTAFVDVATVGEPTNERVYRSAPCLFSSKNVHIQTDFQDHSERLLSKEWLVKIDNEKSVPYLMVRPSIRHIQHLKTSPCRSYTLLSPIKHAFS